MLSIKIDNRRYEFEVLRRVDNGPKAIRILIPTFMPNELAQRLTEVCVKSIKKYTLENHEIWVVDNNSPEEFNQWLYKDTTINVVFNCTEPVPPKKQKSGLFKFISKERSGEQGKDASYANAIGLKLGARCIDEDTPWLFTMHCDALALRSGWLSYLKSKLSSKVRAVGCWRDNIRVHALHIGGLLMDFTLFKPLGMNFMNNVHQEHTTAYPEYDVGDLITIRLKEHGYDVVWCQNTYNNPELVARIQDETLGNLHSDRCFDDDWNVFYIHMGRGILKSIGSYNKEGKTYPREWIEYAEKYVLS